jgi:hypothetical protein
LQQGGECREVILFPGCQRLEYALEPSPEAAISASLAGTILRIGVPAQDLATWCSSDQVGLYAEIPLPEARVLQVLIEKDFRCLDGRNSEDQADTFENPLSEHLNCEMHS